MTAIVSMGGIHLVNSSGAPTAGGVATAAATTPFSIRKGWRPTPAEPFVLPVGELLYPYVHYEPVQETIPISVLGSSHENAVARLQELKRALRRPNANPAILNIQPTGSSNAIQAEITNADVREVPEDESGFEGWEGFSEIYAEITYTRTPLFARPAAATRSALLSFTTFTNTGTGVNPNTHAFPAGLNGDLASEGQPTYCVFTPTATGNFTIFYLATVESRTYSTTGAGAKTTNSTTGASAALNSLVFAVAQLKLGLNARALFRFTNNTANVQVRVEVRATTAGTVLYAGPWITPTSGSATLYDMGRIPIDMLRVMPRVNTATLQLYLGYRSTDGNNATATLGYNEFLLYYDFCRIDSATAVSTAGGSTGFALDVHAFLDDNFGATDRPPLPLAAPFASVYDTFLTGIVDTATIRGRPPRAIEGGSLYLAWMAANNVHDTTKTATIDLYYSPLWRSLRGSD